MQDSKDCGRSECRCVFGRVCISLMSPLFVLLPCVTYNVECFILRASAGRERRSTLSKTPRLSLRSCLKGEGHCTAHHLTPTITQYKNIFLLQVKTNNISNISNIIINNSNNNNKNPPLGSEMSAGVHAWSPALQTPSQKNHYRLRTSGRRPGFNLWETFFLFFCRDILAEC